MCQECGCGRPGPTRIDGKPAAEIPSPLLEGGGIPGGVTDPGPRHTHEHTHEHTHPHDHTHEGIADGQRHSHPHGHEHTHSHDHPHEHPHEHLHAHADGHDHGHTHERRTVDVHQAVLAANDRQAERNRGYFCALNLLVLNVVSAPGSGKTTLLQKTIERLAPRVRVGVIVGDLETDADAQRLRTTGAPVVQITTGTLCHLDAEMIARALPGVNAKDLDLLALENVGNLVCPAAFDLGEHLRVVLSSVTEGEDKPLKYPPLFQSAHAIVVTKIDLAAAVDFQRDTLRRNLRRVNPSAEIIEVSSRTGEGLDAWCEFLLQQRGAAGHPVRAPGSPR
jgi:hydrogenase nickel incorporation protein HypB